MMSKRQLMAMLVVHISYLFLGASIFYNIEGPLEAESRRLDRILLREIQGLMSQNYAPSDPKAQNEILGKLSEHFGFSMFNDSTEVEQQGPVKWDFYHSFFFSYTVVSTIGYGNLAPSTSLSRLIMIFYGLIGVPFTGILFANMAEYFGKKLINLYKSYKMKNKVTASKIDSQIQKLGLIGQIVLYLIPGFLFFIFMPAILFTIFEEWNYVESVYYAFVTLTTIGFGDIVAGMQNRGFAYSYFISYQIFLIIWITFGLGYILMLLGFLTRALRSERIHRLEHKLAMNLKTTQSKLLRGFSKDVSFLRRIINEAYLMKFKPVYVEVNTPCLHRSSSCPDFTYYKEISDSPVPKRKRANSENIYLSTSRILQRIQSDTDLLGIDKDRTFTASAIIQPAQLLARVVDALGSFREEDSDASDTEGVKLFSEDEILATEKPLHQSGWSVGDEKMNPPSPMVRHRASSLIPMPGFTIVPEVNQYPWSRPTNETLNPYTCGRQFGKLSLPNGDHIPRDDKMLKEFTHTRTKLFSKLNPFKRIRLNSMTSKSTNESANEKAAVEEYYKQTPRGRSSMMTHIEHENYIKKTAKGRSSILSLPGREQSDQTDVLEHTSVADLIRALAALHDVTDDQSPRRKFSGPRLNHTPTSTTPKTDSLTSQERRFSLRQEMFSEQERPSIIPPGARRRRLSVRSGGLLPMNHASAIPMTEYNDQRRASLLLPPPYTPLETLDSTSAGQLPRHRRFSPSPGLLPPTGPMARRLSKSPISSLRTNVLPQGNVSGLEPSSAIPRNVADRVKRDSLTDIFINK